MRVFHRAWLSLVAALAAVPCAAQPALPVVVIDAGHGGHDSGAVGRDGTFEKDVALAIARRVAAGLAASGAVAVKLTRGSDRFVALGDRLAFARRHRAALFLSIHADSEVSASARGWTVYGLSDAASSIAASRYAKRENAAFATSGDPDDDTAAVLAAVVRSATDDAALRFAATLRRFLAREVALPANGERRAAFWVLKATEVPSLLLETGYLSNDTDLAYLRSDTGQAAISGAIVAAVVRTVGHDETLDHWLGEGRPALRAAAWPSRGGGG